MNGRKISTALNGLPEDMVAEAMKPCHRGRSFSLLRLTACLAIIVGLCFGFWPAKSEIVTAPGLLTVTVYAMDNNTETEYVAEVLETGVEISDYEWSVAQNFFPGLPVNLSMDTKEFPSENVWFLINVDAGTYLDWSDGNTKELPATFELENDTWIYWRAGYDEEFLTEIYDHVYSSIVIYCEDNIVGYAVLRFDRSERKGLSYTTNLISSVCFPKQNGDYQKVSNEYVQALIGECTNTAINKIE